MAAVYGNIYRFTFDSRNGSAIEIVIAKAGYYGELTTRPLGRAPILRRENNGNIFGTSLEIYPECVVPGEYLQFYTSDAYEYKVTLYRNGANIWSGFITPELYAEPDIPAPDDVQIIATDGLGELKRFDFYSEGVRSFHDHITGILSRLGISRKLHLISQMSYELDASMVVPSDLLNVQINLRHEDENTCYDVLQNILTALHASITLYNGQWLLLRETDLILLTSESGVSSFESRSSEQVLLPVRTFGSSKNNDWWPVGNMNVTVEPAMKSIEVVSPYHYMQNMMYSDLWMMENSATYDDVEGAYILPDEGSNISQKLDFYGERVGYKLSLKIKARNVGSGEEDQNIGIRVKIDGISYAGERQYWLVQSASSDRGRSAYLWRNTEGEIEAELEVPFESDTASNAQEIEIILPLYRAGSRSYIYATSVEVTVFNPSGIHDIYVYEISLTKYDRSEGHRTIVNIDNGARERGEEIDLTMTDGAKAPDAGRFSMTGIPLTASGVVTKWQTGNDVAGEYIDVMARDYAKSVAFPRLRYSGRLNVPANSPIPCIFLRDGTYYWPKTYGLDLYEDEMEVELLSIPAADIDIVN